MSRVIFIEDTRPTLSFLHGERKPGTALTFSDIAFGSASNRRHIFVGVLYTFAYSITVGGVSPTNVVSTTGLDIWRAQPPGTSGDIVVTTGTSQFIAVAAWRAGNLRSATPTDTLASSGSSPRNGSLDMDKDGIAIGITRATAGSVTWASGLTEDYADTSDIFSGASAVSTTAQTLSVQVTDPTGGATIRMLAASYR